MAQDWGPVEVHGTAPKGRKNEAHATELPAVRLPFARLAVSHAARRLPYVKTKVHCRHWPEGRWASGQNVSSAIDGFCQPADDLEGIRLLKTSLKWLS